MGLITSVFELVLAALFASVAIIMLVVVALAIRRAISRGRAVPTSREEADHDRAD